MHPVMAVRKTMHCPDWRGRWSIARISAMLVKLMCLFCTEDNLKPVISLDLEIWRLNQKEKKRRTRISFLFLAFRLWHICGSGHAQKPLSFGQWKRAETDAGFMQDVIRETAGCGAPAGHQELPSTVRVTLEIICSSSCYCLAPLLRSLTACAVPVWWPSVNFLTEDNRNTTLVSSMDI